METPVAGWSSSSAACTPRADSITAASSVSRVTVTPTSRAASQTRAAFSFASFSSTWSPTDVSRSDRSAPFAMPRLARASRRPREALTARAAWSGCLVSSPRWSNVTSRPSAMTPAATEAASSAVFPAT